MIKFIASSLEDTKNFAKEMSKKMTKDMTVLLYGEMGVGKTTFTKLLLDCLGVKSVVTSPTFTIVNQYDANGMQINHFDMYRIEDESEAVEIGLEEMLNDKNALNIVEWPQNLSSLLPKNCVKIFIKPLGECEREFEVEGIDD